MATIYFDEQAVETLAGESVLDALERAGHRVPSSCRSGVCQTCLVRAVGDAPAPAAQAGLKDTLTAQGYFLACRAEPADGLRIASAGSAGLRTPAVIAAVRPLSPDVVEVALRPEAPFAYRPGQFLTVINEAGVARSYSIASVPALDGDVLLLQVAVLPGGAMSGWLQSESALGARVALQGPNGQCFYVPGESAQPLFLLGTGTGLAPLYAIARDALAQAHHGPIHLFHGALQERGLYGHDALRALATAHENFHYHPCALNGPAGEDVHVGAVDALALETVPKLGGYRVFLCGAPEMVRAMQRKAFLAGASMQAIFSDPFVPAAAPAKA